MERLISQTLFYNCNSQLCDGSEVLHGYLVLVLLFQIGISVGGNGLWFAKIRFAYARHRVYSSRPFDDVSPSLFSLV
jgi:hypothetical protein